MIPILMTTKLIVYNDKETFLILEQWSKTDINGRWALLSGFRYLVEVHDTECVYCLLRCTACIIACFGQSWCAVPIWFCKLFLKKVLVLQSQCNEIFSVVSTIDEQAAFLGICWATLNWPYLSQCPHFLQVSCLKNDLPSTLPKKAYYFTDQNFFCLQLKAYWKQFYNWKIPLGFGFTGRQSHKVPD